MALARMLPLLNLPLPVVETSSFLALVQRESLSISNRVPRKKQTFKARCPVALFEAARTVGELHMKPLGGAVLHFQLNDLLDGQVLFEHTVRKPDAISVPVERFFVIRQENESFRGFGFRDKDAADEMKERIQKSVKPFTIQCASSVTITTKDQVRDKSLQKRNWRICGLFLMILGPLF